MLIICTIFFFIRTFNKNPRIAVNKSQLRSKNDKDDSDSDIEFVDIKHNTGSRQRSHLSSNIFY